MTRLAATLSLLLLVSPAAASVRGTIIGNGQPVANAKVIAYATESGEEMIARAAANRPRSALATATSAADGTFTLPVDGAGCVVVRVDATGFASSYAEEALGDSDVLISLAPKKPRAFTLRLPGGPVGGARVVVFNQYGLAETTTDERGKFTIDDVGEAAMLVIDPRVALQYAMVQPNNGVVQVDAGVPLKGKVVDAHGAGVGGARIVIDSVPAAVSAADGSFTIERAPRHYQLLSAEAGDLGGHIGPTSGTPVIRVAPRVAVSGVVRDAERRPLRGLAVQLVGDNDNASAVTDAKGNFTLRVAPGKYAAFVVSTIYRMDGAEFHVQNAVVRDLVAKRAPIFAGIVTDEDNKPVAGAQLTFAMDAPDEEMMTMFERMVPPSLGDFTTGPDGRFRIAVAQLPDEVRLVAYKRGLPPAESDILEPGKDHRDVTLVLRKGVEVGGTVRDTAGHPLAGVAVKALRGRRILFGGLADPLLTDSEGRFSTRVVAGSWRMTFSKDGYLPRVLPQVEVVPGIRPLSVNLDPAASIRGRVVRKDGSGVADVMIVEQMTAPAMTAADGSFALPNVSPGAHVLEYVAAGAHGEKAVTAPADDVRIVLDDAGSVHGRVVDAAGAPVTSFQVGVTRRPEDFARPQQFADPDGRFVFNDAPVGEATVSVEATGFLRATKSVVVEAGKTAGDVTVTLQRGRTVRGKVISTSGEALADVQIGSQASPERGTTSADGSYEVSGVDTTQTLLLFSKPGFVKAVRPLPAGNDDAKIDVQLRPGVVLTGRVVTAGGEPVANAAVNASSSAAGAESESGQTNGDGVFRLDGLAPARYDLSAMTGGDGADSLKGLLPDVDVERVHEVTIRMKPRSSAVIYGDVAGIDPGSKRITVEAASGDASVDTSSESGKYRIANAPTGSVTLRAWTYGGGGSRYTRPVVVEVAPHSEVRADLRFAETFPISGRVLRSGTPMVGAKIDFEDESSNQFNAVTGDGGTYRATVAAGRYHITVGSYSVDRAITGPDTIDINVDLTQVVVTVVDAVNGTPIEQATVSGRDTASSTHAVLTGKTNGSGQVTLDVPHNVSDVVVEKQGYATAVVPPASPSLLVKLTRSDETVVRLVDARDGRPLSGYAVARDAAGRVVASANEAAMDGTIRFALLAGKYRFSASANGYGSHTVAADVPSSDIQIPLPRGGKLLLQSRVDLRGTARLIQPDGEEYVRCWCSGIADTRIDGRSTLVESIAPGSYTLEILQADMKPRKFPVSVIEGETVTVPIDP